MDAELIGALLQSGGMKCAVRRVQAQKDFTQAVRDEKYDVILSDHAMPSFDGVTALQLARTHCPDVPFIFVSGTIGEDVAVDSLKRGASDYILKHQLRRLIPAIHRSLRESEAKAEQRRMEEEVHARERLFQRIADNTDELIAVLNLQGKLVYASPSFRQLFGDKGDGLFGVEAMAQVHPEDRVAISFLFQQTAAGKSSQRAEFRFLSPTGAVRHIEAQGSVILDAGGNVSEVAIVCRDLTEQRKAAERLEVLEAGLRLGQEAVLITDGQLQPLGPCVLSVNPAFTVITGCPAGEVMGKRPWAFDPPVSTLPPMDLMQQAVESAAPVVSEGRGHRKDGSECWVEWTISTLRDNRQAVTHFVLAMRDATARHSAEKRVRDLALLLDQTPDAILVEGLDQRILYGNRGAQLIYGWSMLEMAGQRAMELFLERRQEGRPIRDIVLEKGEWTGELTQITRSGKEVTMGSRWLLLRDADGAPERLLCVNSDITGLKQLEAQFLRSQRRETIGALAGGIAHELNNIFAPVLIASDLVRAKLSDDATRRIMDTVKTSALRGADLVKQILAFARGTQGKPGVVPLGFLLRDVVQLAQNTFSRAIQVEARVPADLPPIRGYPLQLHQALLNLFVNARDAMPEGGRLIVAASRVKAPESIREKLDGTAAGFILVTVTDTGMGISAESREKIFLPFFTTNQTGDSTGLGLTAVAEIVRNHGGIVEVASEPGRGSTFSIYLPEAPEYQARTQERPDDTHLGNGETILLVEDDGAVLDMTQQILTSSRYHVLCARNGLEAVAAFQERRDEIDLIVTDLMMPLMDGAALLHALRRLGCKAGVVCITGMADNARAKSLDTEPGVVLVEKPFTADALLRAVARFWVKPD